MYHRHKSTKDRAIDNFNDKLQENLLGEMMRQHEKNKS